MERDQLGGQALDSYADALVADRERGRRWPPALGDSAFQFSSIDKHQFISSSPGFTESNAWSASCMTGHSLMYLSVRRLHAVFPVFRAWFFSVCRFWRAWLRISSPAGLLEMLSGHWARFIVQVLTQLRSKSTGTFASGSVERGKSSCWDYGTDDGSHNILQCGLPACAPNVINVQIFHCWAWRLEDQANIKTTVDQKSFKHVTEILRTCAGIVTKRVKMDLRVGHNLSWQYWTVLNHKPS